MCGKLGIPRCRCCSVCVCVLAVEAELTHGNPSGITHQVLQCLHMWCAQQYTLVLIADGRLQAARQFLQQVVIKLDCQTSRSSRHGMLQYL